MPGISSVLTEKTNFLKIIGERLPLLSTHDAYLLLRHSSALPKLLYCLRTAPCFLSPQLQQYDAVLKTIMCNTFNIYLSSDHSVWTQAVLPIRHGGLGIRSVVQLAPSAYLASAAASSTLVDQILPPQFSDTDLPSFQEALALWSNRCNQSPPEGITSYHQKSWDIPTIPAMKENLLNSATNESSKSRLLAAFSEESGIWLNALPLSSLGLRMDDSTFQIAVSLRLGLAFCKPHSCHHCGCEVTAFATHGLNCVKSQGRYHRHSSLNDIIHRAFGASRIPSRLEPSGISRSDGKRPDGATLVPWKCGKLLVWDATCVDTYAPSYSRVASEEAGAVADQAEKRKSDKYSNLDPNTCMYMYMYLFAPIVIETSGMFGKQTLSFLKDLACVRKVSGEVKSFPYLLQRLAVAVQRGNAVSVLGTFVSEDCLVFETVMHIFILYVIVIQCTCVKYINIIISFFYLNK